MDFWTDLLIDFWKVLGGFWEPFWLWKSMKNLLKNWEKFCLICWWLFKRKCLPNGNPKINTFRAYFVTLSPAPPSPRAAHFKTHWLRTRARATHWFMCAPACAQTLFPWPLRGSKWSQNGPKWSENDAKMEPELNKNRIKNEGEWESLLGIRAKMDPKWSQNEPKIEQKSYKR